MPLQHQSFLHSHCQSQTNLPTQCQSCQSQTNLLPIHDQSNADLWWIPTIQCQSTTNSIDYQSANSMPIHYQFCNDLLIHHQSKSIMPILDQSTNPSPNPQSEANRRQICSTIHHQSTIPMPIHQGITNQSIQCQPSGRLPILDQFTNQMPILD